MKKNSKKRSLINLVTVLCMVCVLVCTFSTTAFAATQLSSIGIKFEKTHKDGEAPKVTATKNGTEVLDVVWEKDFSSYDPGDVAKATVKLTTKEGYYFKDSYSKSKINLTNATYVSYKYENGDIWVNVKYNVGGKLENPENLRWNGDKVGRACWDKVSNADSYTVILVRGNKTKKVTDIGKSYYDFSDELISDTYFDYDNVYFKVMAVPKNSSNLKSSDYSESDYFDDWDELYWKKYGHYYEDWGDCDDDWRYPVPGYSTHNNGWQQSGTIWYYYENGKYVADCTKTINGHKYTFDENGVMRVGWYLDSSTGKWYYYHPVNGDMLKGWQKVGNAWYYMDPVSGQMYSSQWCYYNGEWYYLDPSGAMATGWRYINGYWYFLKESGAMVTGSYTIDGINYYFAETGELQ